MSQTAAVPKPENSLNQMPIPGAMLAVALVSLSSLLLELALTRLFSVVLFYHFAFFAISVALLGLGSGGVFAHVRQEWLERFDMRTLGTRLCLLNSIFILAAVEVVLHTPVSLEVTGYNFGKLTIIYLAAAVPFFLTGLLFSVLFARASSQIPYLYGADLPSAGFGLHGYGSGFMGERTQATQDSLCRGRGLCPADRRQLFRPNR